MLDADTNKDGSLNFDEFVNVLQMSKDFRTNHKWQEAQKIIEEEIEAAQKAATQEPQAQQLKKRKKR